MVKNIIFHQPDISGFIGGDSSDPIPMIPGFFRSREL